MTHLITTKSKAAYLLTFITALCAARLLIGAIQDRTFDRLLLYIPSGTLLYCERNATALFPRYTEGCVANYINDGELIAECITTKGQPTQRHQTANSPLTNLSTATPATPC